MSSKSWLARASAHRPAVRNRASGQSSHRASLAAPPRRAPPSTGPRSTGPKSSEPCGTSVRIMRFCSPGTRAESRFNADIIRRAGVPRGLQRRGRLSVRTLLALLERAHSMISVDTGPAHAAAALGCPTVALFGTASPNLYRPGGTTTPAVALTGSGGWRAEHPRHHPETVIESWLRAARYSPTHRLRLS